MQLNKTAVQRQLVGCQPSRVNVHGEVVEAVQPLAAGNAHVARVGQGVVKVAETVPGNRDGQCFVHLADLERVFDVLLQAKAGKRRLAEDKLPVFDKVCQIVTPWL